MRRKNWCPHLNGSTDIGDVSQIIPAIHTWIHVIKGKLYVTDFEITDLCTAYVQSAKIISWTLIDLLANGAKKELEIKSTSQNSMTKKTWLSNWLEEINTSRMHNEILALKLSFPKICTEYLKEFEKIIGQMKKI